MFAFWKSIGFGNHSHRTRRASCRTQPLMAQIEVVEPRQLMSANAVSGTVNAAQRSQPNTIDLAIRAVIFDPTRHLLRPGSDRREQFQVDVRIDSLTGREINNPANFSITLYWSRGPQLSDRIGIAASAHDSINRHANHAGDLLHILVPQGTRDQTNFRQPADATHLVAEVSVISGGIESDRSDNVSSVTVPTARQLASQVLSNSSITLATEHPSGVHDQANARANIASVASGNLANRSHYRRAPGGTTELDPRMLQTMLALARRNSFSVSEIAGGSHTAADSLHYQGQAIDINVLNGHAIVFNQPGGYSTFLQQALAQGAERAFLERNDSGNGAHIHVQWFSDPAVRRAT